ncbi:ATP-binding cassette domain-containing protein [Streptomyces sp. NPDC020192]|uniref:ATP-binding cassette domain-containing protein n=1 Tax=Streptomyces sp. NPDC020192 TaxID=3365066 RepID=UPI0037AE807B
MIQAFGLTSNSRKAHPPAVDDVSFEARAGQVTALLGSAGAGKTTALRLMLELQEGRGITHFRGRPLHSIAHPSREVGVLLGDVPGHPARSVRGHLRMLCAASGVPARRADEVLEVVGLVSLREERLGTLSCGMDRRLGLACALLPDPHTLVLDEPADGLSTREAQWLHGMLRAHAQQGGTVVFTTADPKEAARAADHVITLDGGRLKADQDAREFARTRLRPRVAVRSPHAARLAALLTKEARTARRSVEVVREGGNRLSVYGSTTADVGDTAFRHGILVHQLADEVGDMGSAAGAELGVSSAEAGEVVAKEPQGRDEHSPSGSPAAEPETVAPGPPAAESALEFGSGAAPSDPGSSVPDSPAPERATVAFGFTPAEPNRAASDVRAGEPGAVPAGFSAERRECADAGVPAPEPTVSASSSDENARGASTHASAERAQSADGERPLLGEAPAYRAGAEHAETTCDARAESGSPGALPEAGGTLYGGAALGGEDGAGGGEGMVPAEVLAGADGNGAVDVSAGAAPGVVAVVQEAQDSSTSIPAGGVSAASISALRARLPGARNPGTRQTRTVRATRSDAAPALDALSSLPPPISVRSAPSPLRPLRYEIRRATGIGVGFLTCGVSLAVSAIIAVLLARLGHTPQALLFAAWPRELPLPPAALAAGLLGALAFGDEFRHPALAADRGTVPRRLGLLTAKLLVSGATAVLLAFLTVGCDAEVLYIVYGRELAQVPADWLSLGASWFGLVVGCAWAGVLAAGVFRSTAGGLAAVLAVPVLVVPVVHKVVRDPALRMAAGFPERMREVFLLQWPFGGERYLLGLVRVLAQPVGSAMALSLVALLCAYLVTMLRTRFR